MCPEVKPGAGPQFESRSSPFRLGNPQSCRGHNKGERRYAIRGDLCVCCNCGCPSHRHLARTCVGQSQWQGSALDGHVDGAGPDRIDRTMETVKRGRTTSQTGAASPLHLLKAVVSCELECAT